MVCTSISINIQYKLEFSGLLYKNQKQKSRIYHILVLSYENNKQFEILISKIQDFIPSLCDLFLNSLGNVFFLGIVIISTFFVALAFLLTILKS